MDCQPGTADNTIIAKEQGEENQIEEHTDIDAIEIFPMRQTLILHGELEVKILIETLKKYLRE